MPTHPLRVKVQSAQRLDEAMKFRGYTNRTLAARTGVHRSSIAHWRSGRRNRTDFATALRISEALDMPTGYLFAPEMANGALADRRSA